MNSFHKTNIRFNTLKSVYTLSFYLGWLLFFGACSTAEKSKLQTPASFQTASRENTWVPQADPFMAARMNAPFFYNWLHELEKKDLGMQALFKIQSPVGDSHFLNYSDWTSKNGQAIIRLSDPDDHGQGPMLAEIMRFSTVAMTAGLDLKSQELVEAYFQGLAGKKAKSTPAVSEVEKLTTDKLASAQLKYLNNLYSAENGTYSFSKKSKITPMTEAPVDLRKYFLAINQDLLAWMASNEYKILLEGFSIKKDGGSAGYPRFQFLVENSKGSRQILEFKYQPAAPAVSSYDKKQQGFSDRLEMVKKSWIGEPVANVMAAIEIKHNGQISQFYIRERKKTHYEIEDIDDPAEKRKNILYLAQQLGYWTFVFEKEKAQRFFNQFLNTKKKQHTISKIVASIDDYQNLVQQQK
jgi:hypothetical protein